VRAARGDGATTALAFWALRAAKGYCIWCKRTRVMERSSPEECGGRRCNGGRTATTTGGEGVGLPRRGTMPGWPGPLDGGNRSGRFLRRRWGGQHGSGNTGGRQLLGGDSPAAMGRAQIRRAPGHGEDWDEQWRLGETRESGRGQEKGMKGLGVRVAGNGSRAFRGSLRLGLTQVRRGI
jgi:hypothetical protein